jgi:hypothetical protein
VNAVVRARGRSYAYVPWVLVVSSAVASAVVPSFVPESPPRAARVRRLAWRRSAGRQRDRAAEVIGPPPNLASKITFAIPPA